MLKLEKLSKDYGNGKGITNLSFQVAQGKICGLLGSNGCGKTTTFRILLGLIEQDSGNVYYQKKQLEKNNYCLFGYVPEERSMLRSLSVKEHVYYLARLKKMSYEKIQESFDYWSQYLKIEEYNDTKIIELSKGNQQKVQMLCALIHNPDIIIFDEPLNGLDVNNVDIFKGLLMKLKQEKKVILISSHQYHNIEHFCDYVVYLKEGKILFKGDIEKLKLKKALRYLSIHTKKDILLKEVGVLAHRREKDYLILTMENKEASYACIEKLLAKGIEDFSLELISLQDIIREKSA
ncbi:MAG: ATP-binding cassette domain-containing protein [Erysipelotrichia bacterium]|nr:ATP-binding cassette domain-containing protein [Erysipelotrichia bacterium]